MREEIIKHFMNELGKSEKRAVEMYEKLQKHTDILNEYFNYLETGKYENEKGEVVEILGYTAERLVNETYLKPIGAYNYLIYLKEELEQAIKDLKNGLPRR